MYQHQWLSRSSRNHGLLDRFVFPRVAWLMRVCVCVRQALILTNNNLEQLENFKYWSGITTLILGKNKLSTLPPLHSLHALNKLTLCVLNTVVTVFCDDFQA